jgi:hypothetical protein
MIVRQRKGLVVEHSGDQHRGWLPRGASVPKPTERVIVVCDVTILRMAGGFLLNCCSRDPQYRKPPYSWDNWHERLEDAESDANSSLGIGPDDWELAES